MTVGGLEQALAALDGVGPADYSDDGMIQYLRAERIVPPYQTKGYKLVELVRIYEAKSSRLTTVDSLDCRLIVRNFRLCSSAIPRQHLCTFVKGGLMRRPRP